MVGGRTREDLPIVTNTSLSLIAGYPRLPLSREGPARSRVAWGSGGDGAHRHARADAAPSPAAYADPMGAGDTVKVTSILAA